MSLPATLPAQNSLNVFPRAFGLLEARFRRSGKVCGKVRQPSSLGQAPGSWPTMTTTGGTGTELRRRRGRGAGPARSALEAPGRLGAKAALRPNPGKTSACRHLAEGRC